jgi:hypothetical protein
MQEFVSGEAELKQQFEAEKAHAARNYTRKIIDDLAAKCKITEPAKIKSLEKFLHLSAWNYERHKSEAEKKLKIRKLRSQIQDIGDLAFELKAQLHLLHPVAEKIFWRQSAVGVQNPAISGNVVYTGPMGQTIIQTEIEPGTYEDRYLNRIKIEEAIHLMGNFAQSALRHTPDDAGGRPKGEPVQNWTTSMREFWTQELGRKFTYAPNEGEGYTPAYVFCKAALKPLDPAVTPSALATAMRKTIRLHPAIVSGRTRGKARKNPP